MNDADLAAAELERRFRDARQVPLTRDVVRVDRDEILGYVDQARAAAPPSALSVVDELDELVARAKVVPLTDSVRIDRKQALDLVRRLQDALRAEARRGDG